MSDTSSVAERASALLDLGRAKDAEREVRQGLSASPQDLELHLELARALLMQERHEEALEASRSALALAPDHPYALLLRSGAQAAAGDNPGALASINDALRVAPEASILHRQRGHILHQDDRLAEALSSFEKARALDPQDADAVVGIAGALLDLRRDDEASQAITDALALDPNHAGAHRLRGLHSMRHGTSRAALDSSRDAVRLDPTNAQFREELSVAMKARNPLYRALWRFSDWLDRQPDIVKTGSLFVPLILSRAFTAVGGDAAWVNIALTLIIGVVAITWLVEPLMNAVILASRYGRGLLPTVTKRATSAFLALVVVAIGCAIAGLLTGGDELQIVALGALAWSATVGAIPNVPAHRRKAMTIIAATAAAAILLTIGLVAVGAAASGPMAFVVLLSGLASLWGVVALTR